VSVHFEAARNRWVVRWREHGKNRTRRFVSVDAAEAFDESVRRPAVAAAPGAPARSGDGIYAYGTSAGIRFRFVFRQSDGTMSSRRGFPSRRAAAAARRRVVESIERGEVKVARESFGDFWSHLLAERRPYLTSGSFADFETHGRKRLLPAFSEVPLARLDEELVRTWLGEMATRVESGKIAAKTINNARTCLSVALNEACRRGLIARNPCVAVPALPVHRAELDYLRLDEIDPYLDACLSRYRPLARFLIGTGARVSEALALQFQDLALDQGVARIYRQRDRDGGDARPTKGKRFRSVQIGPALVEALATLQRSRNAEPSDWVFLCPIPRRGRYSRRTIAAPPNRRTVHDWHEAALVDAGLRDMPLHALRHTAAAAWLATGHPLIFVQRQLGHRSITTTEEHYGHLEQSFVRDAVAQTEKRIAAARRAPA
jgi:integrase